MISTVFSATTYVSSVRKALLIDIDAMLRVHQRLELRHVLPEGTAVSVSINAALSIRAATCLALGGHCC
jgi:hypothetical protein